MGVSANMWIIDNNGQEVKGNSKVKGRENSIDVLAIDHSILLPFDINAGKITALHKHRPLTILKHIDASTPVLQKACCDGRMLQKVKISLYDINKLGKEQ